MIIVTYLDVDGRALIEAGLRPVTALESYMEPNGAVGVLLVALPSTFAAQRESLVVITVESESGDEARSAEAYSGR